MLRKIEGFKWIFLWKKPRSMFMLYAGWSMPLFSCDLFQQVDWQEGLPLDSHHDLLSYIFWVPQLIRLKYHEDSWRHRGSFLNTYKSTPEGRGWCTFADYLFRKDEISKSEIPDSKHPPKKQTQKTRLCSINFSSQNHDSNFFKNHETKNRRKPPKRPRWQCQWFPKRVQPQRANHTSCARFWKH